MAAFGRIRRNKAKVRHRSSRERGFKKVNANVKVWRTADGVYKAAACIGSPPKNLKLKMPRPKVLTDRARCGAYVTGRTPSSAIAKAFKALGQSLASRGRRM